MITRRATLAFTHRGPVQREEIAGVLVTLKTQDGATVASDLRAVLGATRSKREQVEGGYLQDHDTLCRVRKNMLTTAPVVGQTIHTADGLVLRIQEVVNNPIAFDYGLGLKDL